MNTLFDADDGFSYSVSKDFIKSLVVFCSQTLKATEDANDNLMVPKAFLSRTFQSSLDIVSGFFSTPSNGKKRSFW